MESKKIISSFQMAFICVLIRTFTLFAYAPVNIPIRNGCGRFLGNLFGFILSLAMWIPAYYIFKSKDDYNIIDFSKSISPLTAKITAILFYFTAISIAIVTVSQFNYFITTTIYPNSPKLLYVIILIGVGILYSLKGLEPMGRVAGIFFVMFIISMIFVYALLVPNINLINLISPFYDGVKPIITMSYSVAAQNTPLIILLLLKSNIKEDKQKSYITYIIISFIIFELILFLIITVLGEYSASKPFAVYALTSVAQGSILKRYDSVHMFIWIFTALIRFSIFLYLAVKSLEEFLPNKSKNVRTAITAIIVLFFSSICVYNISIFDYIIKVDMSGFALILTGVVLPIILIFLKKKKDKELAGGFKNE